MRSRHRLPRPWSIVPLKRLCDPALSALRPPRAGRVAPRTPGKASATDHATSWPAALLLPSALPGLSAALAARATVLAVERFYTTVEQIRERVTEGWRDLTLTKETHISMTYRRAALSLLPVSQGGVAGNRQSAVFCQQRPARLPRSFGFDRCSRPGFLGGLRRYQD